jgi:hypothetical protein
MEKYEYERVELKKEQSFLFVDEKEFITFICSYREDVKAEIEICYSGFNLFINDRYVGSIKGFKMLVLEGTENPTKIYFRKELK